MPFSGMELLNPAPHKYDNYGSNEQISAVFSYFPPIKFMTGSDVKNVQMQSTLKSLLYKIHKTDF